MRIVKVAAAAENDLQETLTYVSQFNPSAAEKLIKEIVGKFGFLRDNPQAGTLRNKLMLNLRSFVIRDDIILYQPIENGIEILRVLHGSRDIEGVFEEFFDSL
jgi:toxin ParE1/3/4